MIDRSNYEIWLTDLMDGNLTKEQNDILTIFLAENPDIREEFDELKLTRIHSTVISFPGKNSLLKEPADLSDTQFDLLCAAMIENDLSEVRIKELEAVITADEDKKHIFDQFKMTKLTPPFNRFPYKKKLLKHSLYRQTIKLALTGLSAAALISLVLLNRNIFTHNITYPSVNNTPDLSNSGTSMAVLTIAKPGRIIATGPHPQVIINKPSLSSSLKSEPQTTEAGSSVLLSAETVVIKDIPYSIHGNELPSIHKLTAEIALPSIIAASKTDSIFIDDDEEPRLSRFIARVLRSKVLKEPDTKDSPLKGYEIAEAGVTGLNKLLGWSMTLDRQVDEKGEIKSVYFNSRMIRFSAPVKKTEQTQ